MRCACALGARAAASVAAATRLPAASARRRGLTVAAAGSGAGSVIRITPWQRLIVGAGAAVAALVDPARGDMVALLGELTGEPALRRMAARMTAHPDGAALLTARPRIRRATVQAAIDAAPPGSLGAAYREYLGAHGFSPDERSAVVAIADPTLAYVMTRYRETHDFVHVLAGLPPSVLGETAVKWLEMVQTGLPMAALSALVAPARLSSGERSQLLREYVPWAARVGREAVDLLCVPYERLLSEPLEGVRRQLRFEAAPAPWPEARR